MELIKRSERTQYSGRLVTKSIPAIGGRIERLGTYSKWIDVSRGRLLDSMGLYEAHLPDGKCGWVLIDPLGQLACNMIPDKNEIMDFLKNDGWVKLSQTEDDDEEEMED